MIIHLSKNASTDQIETLEAALKTYGALGQLVKTQTCAFLVAIHKHQIDLRRIASLPGVQDIHYVPDPYQLVSRKWRTKETVIELPFGQKIGGGSFTCMAGPCSIESADQIDSCLQALADNRLTVMRGGVFKPRTSPYSFRGAGIDALSMWSQKAKERGIHIISEVLEPSQIEPMLPYVDIFQVGARNSQNFSLLHELGKVDKPVLIKRGISGTIDELLQSAEYVFAAGNEKLLICERGIRTFEGAYRNTLDINAIPVLKEKTHLPVIVDPSHGIGIRRFVPPLVLAAVMAGADGVLIETHPCPEKAKSDGDQTLNFAELSSLVDQLEKTVAFRASL